MRILAMIAMAIGNLFRLGGQALDWTWKQFCSLLPGGGGSAQPGTLDLPSKDEHEVERGFAESQQRAHDALANAGPARQVKLYAESKSDDRYTVDLSMLQEPQRDWLIGLSDREMKALAEAPESKITMLLGGHDGAVLGLDAPKVDKPRAEDPGLVARISDFRTRLAAREGDHVLAA